MLNSLILCNHNPKMRQDSPCKIPCYWGSWILA